MPADGAPAKWSSTSLPQHDASQGFHRGDGKDIAKRLLDYGYMAPTLYFPMIVPECLMFEPTETESKEAIDQFADDFPAILGEDPELVKTAPHDTPVKRVDEVWAARNLILRHPIDE